jgi:hypothetical protein
MENGPKQPNSAQLTPRQRRAIPLILAARSIASGCQSARIAKQIFSNWLRDEAFREKPTEIVPWCPLPISAWKKLPASLRSDGASC